MGGTQEHEDPRNGRETKRKQNKNQEGMSKTPEAPENKQK